MPMMLWLVVFTHHIGVLLTSQCIYFKQNLKGSSLAACDGNRYHDTVEMMQLCRQMPDCRGFNKADGSQGKGGQLLCGCMNKPGIGASNPGFRGSLLYMDDRIPFQAGKGSFIVFISFYCRVNNGNR